VGRGAPRLPESRATTRGVAIAPGATSLTRIRCGASSIASDLTRDMTPAFAAPYGAWNGEEASPLTEETETMLPPLPLSHELSAARSSEVEEMPEHRVHAVVPVLVGESGDRTPADLGDGRRPIRVDIATCDRGPRLGESEST
jgi:hypothetical protein